ncbi:MAG TPA: Coq4 family protein [Spongiibacteraceae bacterium]|jgi:ubiquinone biosynthesis protein Coq4
MKKPDLFSSLGVAEKFTDSSVLISSSKYLNHPLLREALATSMLRRNGRDRRIGWESQYIVMALREIRDADHINAMIADERKINPRLDQWFTERHMSTFRRADLANYPENSLGKIFHDCLVEQNLDIDLDNRLRENPLWRPVTDLEYFEARGSQTHDFEHLMGGTGFDYLSELVPFWVRIENTFKHINNKELASELSLMYVLFATAMFTRTVLHYPKAWQVIGDYLQHSIAVGRAATPLLTFKYEDVLHLPLAEARQQLGYPAVKQFNTYEISDYWSEGAQFDPGIR